MKNKHHHNMLAKLATGKCPYPNRLSASGIQRIDRFPLVEALLFPGNVRRHTKCVHRIGCAGIPHGNMRGIPAESHESNSRRSSVSQNPGNGITTASSITSSRIERRIPDVGTNTVSIASSSSSGGGGAPSSARTHMPPGGSLPCSTGQVPAPYATIRLPVRCQQA